MLPSSQPLNLKTAKRLRLGNKKEFQAMTEKNIKSQRIGRMFDNFDRGSRKNRISLKTRLGWKWRDLKGAYTEEKYSHSEECYKRQKFEFAKETVKILKRMRNPEMYATRRRKKVEEKYPKYKQLLTEYKYGGSSSSGYFVEQGNGWAGMESGKDPREGYFEFINGRFELVNSPNQAETDRLLAELREYHKEIDTAYKQAEIDSDKNFEKLGRLLKENMYKWWD